MALGALIPVSDSMRTNGATELIANWLSMTGAELPPLGAIALVMSATMLATPFLNNAATVLVMGPIAAGIAANLGYRPDPFLMAVSIGAASDFLTPVGHQSKSWYGDRAATSSPITGGLACRSPFRWWR